MKRIVVVGGGPGGYVAAIRAAQLGAEVHLAENSRLGGTCLNVGCIPAKALLHAAFFYKHARANRVAGVKIDGVRLDWQALQQEKQKITDRLAGGVGGLLKANKVTVHNGTASLSAGGQNGLQSVSVNGKALPAADAVILATGSVPVKLNFPGADLPEVIDSTQALSLKQAPASLLIVGGGVIGVEFASLYAALGSKVTIVEMAPEILPSFDRQAAVLLRGALAKASVDVFTGAAFTAVKKSKGGHVVSEIEVAGEKRTVESEWVLVAVGRKPCTGGIDLEGAGVKTDRGAAVVDGNFETSRKGVFAVGDCNAKIMLAHAASAQGEAAAAYILEGRHHYNGNVIPGCVYTEPEIAAVGLTEAQAKERGIDCVCGIFDLSGNGKSLISGDNTGFVKIVADKELGEIIGVHMMGPGVTDMIGEAAAVMSMEGVVEDLVRTIHAHPTVNEAIHEAAQAVFGNAVHWPPRM
ncbi:MAG: dihydrolipoyl dehydrogenase [Clostridiales Family XIII bacterium]|jgi:dihydrolipoamide dehydrogenase|nr:dihydrolipoyl dehydrogenase [Clostridiales Family XIII bacterium]